MKRAFKYTASYYRQKKRICLKEDCTNSLESLSSNSLNTNTNRNTEVRDATNFPEDQQIKQNEPLEHKAELHQMEELSNEAEVHLEEENTLVDEISEDVNQEPDSQSVEETLGLKIRDFLPNWMIQYQIPHVAVSALLKNLIYCGVSGLPKDSRTLIGTPRTVHIEKMGSGYFWYNGLKNCIYGIENYMGKNELNTLNLSVNIDGLPITNSSKSQFWPILVKVTNIEQFPPQIVAIFSGDSKPPSAEEYLQKFVDDLKGLLESGIQINNKKFSIKLNNFICDTPARSFIKCVVSFNAYHSCLRCTVVGEYYNQQKRMSFPQVNCQLRSDEEFRAKTDVNHHQKNQDGEFKISPLEQLPIDMIQDIIIADALHLLHLGLTKRCLNYWVHGSKDLQVKFFNDQINAISSWLEKSNERIPSEIHRSVRSLSSLAFWKGVEYRTFLLYLGPVILKDNLPTELYNHFLLLFCANFLCSCSCFSSKLDLAEKMFKDYIEGFINIYGVHSISSNIHNLCHVVEDVKRFGPLDKLSSYAFENKLGMIKNRLKSGYRPLAQIAKQELESKNHCVYLYSDEVSLKYEILDQHQKPIGVNSAFKKVLQNGICFAANVKDQWMLTKNNEILKIHCIFRTNNELMFYGSKIQKKSNFFDYPFPSSKINIYLCKEIFTDNISIKEQEIKCKLVSIDYNNQLVFIPLVHTFDIFNK